MKFWMSGEIMGDVDEDFGKVNQLIESAINFCLEDKNYGDGLTKWYFFAMILNTKGPPYKERKLHDRKKKEVEFRLKIDHDAFFHADKSEQIRLVSESMLRSIDLMSEMRIHREDVSRCLTEVQVKVN